MTSVFLRKDRLIRTHREDSHVMMDAEIGVMQLPVKEHQGCLKLTGLKQHKFIILKFCS